ncbi:MAG: YceD family protein [Cocleimonas sp.]
MSSNSTIQRLPLEVDPFKLVEQGRLFEGRIPQQDFLRLQDLLFSNDEDNGKLVEVNLEFTRTDTRLPVIKGHIKAELQMVCNRCLEATDLSIDTAIEVVLVSTDAQAERLQEGFDIWMVEDQTLFLRDFIEDEILLAMPIVISHDDCEPARELIESLPGDEDTEEQEKENPFAALKDLKLN